MSGTINLVGYHLTFDDEFTTSLDLAPFANNYPWGGTSLSTNGELENYVPAASNPDTYTINGGALTITASPTPSNGLPYTSGMLSTADSFSQNTGYFEIRAAMPSQSGFWPAFWMLPEGAGYPEIDILEQPNNSGTQTDYWTHTSTPTNSSGGFTNTGTDVFSGYHTYGFLWTNDTIQYTFDGQLVGSPQQTPPALAAEQMYMIANLAVGGWPGTPATDAVSTYNIDYIRAYSSDSNVAAVPMEAISSPDGANTTPTLGGAPVAATPAIGSGPDQLVLTFNEDQFLSQDAQFTVSIDGVQQGGTFTASAQANLLQTQLLTLNTNVSTGTHTVTVDFLNDANGPTGDRNLFLLGGSLDGVDLPQAVLKEYSGGAQSFSVVGPGTAGAVVNPGAVTIGGTGPDQFVLNMSQSGSAAEFTVLIDGVQQGSTYTTTANSSTGALQAFTVDGTFLANSSYTVAIDFLNQGTAAGQAGTLSLLNASINGASIGGSGFTETADGSQAFSFVGNDAIGASFSPPPPPPTPVTIGSGPDTLTLFVAEDAYLGNAEFTISIDAVQQGGTYTTNAINSAGETQAFNVEGSFGTTSHTVSVDFLNDNGGSGATDRNLYVKNATVDGIAIPNSILNEYSGGAQSFSFIGNDSASTPITPPPTPTSTPVTLGTGPDTLTLLMAEDAYEGNAEFTVSVDGVQQGGTFTTTAINAAGQTQAFSVEGSFGTAAHTVSVDFLNDNGGYGATDRNLYVKGASINGATITDSTLNEYGGGPESFSFIGNDSASNPVTTPTSTSPPAVGPVISGSGPDTLTLNVAEDAYQGNAEFTVSVDGVQQGGTYTATAINAAGETQAFNVEGSFGTVTHTVSVDFLNDNGGYGPTDRNLYVKNATINGTAITNSTLNEYAGGPQSFSFIGNDPGTLAPAGAPTTTPVTNSDTITVGLTESAYNGNAQASIVLDGVTLGQPIVTFLNSGGIAEAFTYTGDFGGRAISHDLAVSLLNAGGGSGTTGANLYVQGATFDGTSNNFAATLFTNTTDHFTIAATNLTN